MDKNINVLDLPDMVLENILSFLTYDEIAKNRLVCKKFNQSCKSLLNRGFIMVERRQSIVSRTIKHCLPRRESERRAHPLARHCEILSALETRISMLSMTFMKFIETGLCCFIPGKIIDEILHILKVVQVSASPPRTHDLLQELRDISSMAMEHFEEHIVPSLRESDANNAALNKHIFQSSGFSRTGRQINVSDFFRKEFKAIHQNTKAYRQQLSGLRRSCSKLSSKVKNQGSVIAYQCCKLREQRRLINQQSGCISEMKKQLDDFEKRFTELSNEINKQKTTISKASQTNEYKTDLPTATQSILNDLNNTYPTSLPEINNRLLFNNHIFEEIKSSLSNTYASLFSNIQPRFSFTGYKYSRENSPPPPPKTQQYEWYSKSIHLPHRRTTISDFRANMSKQENIEQKSNTALLAEKSGEQLTEVRSRKRKIIDLIAKVVDTKIPKKETVDNNELAHIFRKYPHLTKHNDDEFTNVVENLIGKKRLTKHDLTDEIPNKRLLGVCRTTEIM